MGFKNLKIHERQCKENVNRTCAIGHKGGNHFTTGKSKTHSDFTKNKMSQSQLGKAHTEETKKKLSIIRKLYLENNPDKVPYLLNHSSKISYPEQYFIDCFINDVDAKFQHHVYRYKLDFANVKEKLYFEIDGEQHYNDKRIVEHDIKRTQKLNEMGWTCFRLRWSHFQKLNEEEKKQKVLEIRFMMKWYHS